MRAFILYLILATLAYFIVKKYMERQVYVKYLQDVGIPTAIIMDMSLRELKASFCYLKQYAKDGHHFNVNWPNYDLLADIRNKYVIFT